MKHDDSTLSPGRRTLLQSGALGAAGILLGFFVPSTQRLARAGNPAVPLVNAILRIAPDNTVVILVNRLECGQGISTALPMLIAEELDADWTKVRAELAPAGALFRDVQMGIQITGGSSSVAGSHRQYREIGARARAMLIAAAAQQWQVDPGACRVANSVVSGPGGQRATFGQLAAAAGRLPVPGPVNLKAPHDFRLIGKPTRRLDSRPKVDGSEIYGIDVQQPQAKTVLIARPPVFGATVAGYDAAGARAVPGVVAVLELPGKGGIAAIAVVAENFWAAKTARDRLVVTWDDSRIDKTGSQQQMRAYRDLARSPGTLSRQADMAGLADSAQRIEAEFEFPYLAHAPMEPLNCTVLLTAEHCTVWTGTQFQTADHAAIAATAQLPPEHVTLHTVTAGGAFGRRAVPDSHYIVEAVLAAKALRAHGVSAPVKVMWTREDDLRGGYYRPSHVHRADIGFEPDGRVRAWRHVIVGQSILTGTQFEPFMVRNGVDHTMVEGMSTSYDLPMELSVHNATCHVPVLWWRSVGSTHTAFVMETLIDEIAVTAKVDPVAYRKRLMGTARPRHLAALDLAVKHSSYGRALPPGHAFGVAQHESFNSVVAMVVQATIHKGVPRLVHVWAGVHCNLAVNPLSIEAQVQGAVVMGLGMTLPGAQITLRDGIVEQSNFNDYAIPRMTDMPKVDVYIVPSTDPPTGMGEPGLPPLAPAFANALFRLTGERLRKLPFALKP